MSGSRLAYPPSTATGGSSQQKAVLAYNSGTFPISSGSTTTITFDSEQYDNDSMHSTITNTSRITFNTAGKYAIKAYIEMPTVTSYMFIVCRLNGTTGICDVSVPAVAIDVTAITMAFDYTFALNDYIEVRAFQSSGVQQDSIIRFSAMQILY